MREFTLKNLEIHEIDELKTKGLSDDDIQLLFDFKRGEVCLFDKYKNCNPDVLRERIAKLQCSIEVENKNVLLSTSTEIGRHQTEAFSIKPESTETKLLKFALSNQRRDEPSAQPMKNLKMLHDDLLQRGETPNCVKIRREARKLARRIQSVKDRKEKGENKIETESANLKKEHLFIEGELVTIKSKWDMREAPQECVKPTARKTYTCKPQHFYTIKNGQIVKLTPEEVEAKNLSGEKQKLSLEEIRKLPKFTNYEEGAPSEKLYLKNLHPKLTEEELKGWFRNHERSIVSFRIMNGPMKGQGFISCTNEVAAKRIIDEMNGVLIRSKPLIIQFGRNRDGPSNSSNQ